jgi:hypothetical protein
MTQYRLKVVGVDDQGFIVTLKKIVEEEGEEEGQEAGDLRVQLLEQEEPSREVMRNPRKHGYITIKEAQPILMRSEQYFATRIRGEVPDQRFDGVWTKDNGRGMLRWWVLKAQIEAHRDWLNKKLGGAG